MGGNFAGARKVRSLLLRTEDGQGMAEYTLILALVVVVSIAAVTTLGSNTIQGLLNSAATL
jgi:pilus assembly protein Flp/PilA